MKIRSKLFLIIMGILLLNLAVTYVFAGFFMEKLYTRSKTNELLEVQEDISREYDGSSDALSAQIEVAEQRNITVLIFSMSGRNAGIEYFSRNTDIPSGMGDMMRGRYSPLNWINYAYNSGLLNQLSEAGGSNVITLETDPLLRTAQSGSQRSLNVFSVMTGGKYLFLETPVEQIESTAMLGLRYMLLISAGTILLAAVVMIFVSQKISAPILEASNAANRIANLDFGVKCNIGSDDELGELGMSINSMADRLQENLERLTAMNALLREDLEREEESNRVRRDFIANVSHDFKTPISLIAAYGESVRDMAGHADDPDKVKDIEEQCEIIISESRKMDDLVNQLLRLAVLESKAVVLTESVFDLDRMITEVVQNSGILIREKNLHVDLPGRKEEGSRKVRADRPKMIQVFQNLLDNAVRHSEEGAVIRINVEENAGDVSGLSYRVKIYNDSDIKPGTDPNTFFASFYKGDDSRGLQDKSYGLGLSIVKAITDLHERECGAYTEGSGIVFWFDIQASAD
ncbi:MAG: HAMP domain-containing sensor histidine kinase [Saccharofermentanales bacterium]